MGTDTLPVLQAVLGLNNVDDPKASGFQVGPRGGLPKYLAAAQNVDLDKDGYVRRRVGRTKRVDLASAHSLWASSTGRLFLVDSGELKEVAPDFSLRTIDVGLGDYPVSYAEVAGTVFYANEHKVGAVDGFWGVQMPSTPFCMPIAGGLPAGRYLVAVTAIRGGVESGARPPAAIELTGPGALDIQVAGVDPSADALAIYCSQPNGQDLYFARETADTSSVVLDAPLQALDPLTTFGYAPPPPGQHIAAYRGRLLVAAGNALYWSQPLAYHHFRVQTDVQLFDDRIVSLGALDAGFFVSTVHRSYFVSGADPSEWQPRLVDTRRVAEGQPLRLPAYKLPQLQGRGEVLVWATEDGFVAGLADGSAQHLTDGRLAVDAFKQASLAFREEGGIRQILSTLRTKESDTRFGASDRVTCRVIRANESVGEP